MKVIELRKKSPAELEILLREQLSKKEELVVGLRQKKVKNVKSLRGLRKDIARIKTLLRAEQP